MTRKTAGPPALPSDVCTVNKDGSITFRGRTINVPGVCLEEIIGSGANGFVVKGHHRILSKPLAVKFWVTLRTRDARDKMAQGIAEVNKLIMAEDYRSVVVWRNAGVEAGLFWASMDLFPGRPLQSWLKDRHPLGLRRLLAYRLVDEVCGMAYNGVYHGDLHTKNVMVDERVSTLLEGREPRLGIIDFGTSMFTSRGASRARHWRVFAETIDRLLSPFRLRALGHAPPTPSADASSIRAWYRICLASIRHALIQLGAEWLIDAEETHDFHKEEWPSRDVMLSSLFPLGTAALSFTKGLEASGALVVSSESLGLGPLWWIPDRLHDPATFDGFGPSWSTSITDRAWWS
jgi:serine/threonine protein kinase